MASMRDLGDRLDALARNGAIKTHVMRMVEKGTERNVALGIEGLTANEARDIVVKVIEIEQARTGDILSPTEYANRFSGLDFE